MQVPALELNSGPAAVFKPIARIVAVCTLACGLSQCGYFTKIVTKQRQLLAVFKSAESRYRCLIARFVIT